MADSDEFQWIPSPGLPGVIYGALGEVTAFCGFAAWVLEASRGWVRFRAAVEFLPKNGDWLMTYVFWVVCVGGPLTAVVVALWSVPTKIGVGAQGLRIVTRLARQDVPWGAIQTGSRSLRGDWGALRKANAARWGLRRLIWMTKDQARAVLNHPAARALGLPIENWSWIGKTQSH